MENSLPDNKQALLVAEELIERMGKRTKQYAGAIDALTAYFKEALYKEGESTERFLALTAPKEIYETLLPEGVSVELATEIRRTDLIFQAALQAAVLNISKDRFWNTQYAVKTCVSYKAKLDNCCAEVKVDVLRQITMGVVTLKPRVYDVGPTFDSGLWRERIHKDQREASKILVLTKFSYPKDI